MSYCVEQHRCFGRLEVLNSAAVHQALGYVGDRHGLLLDGVILAEVFEEVLVHALLLAWSIPLSASDPSAETQTIEIDCHVEGLSHHAEDLAPGPLDQLPHIVLANLAELCIHGGEGCQSASDPIFEPLWPVLFL